MQMLCENLGAGLARWSRPTLDRDVGKATLRVCVAECLIFGHMGDQQLQSLRIPNPLSFETNGRTPAPRNAISAGRPSSSNTQNAMSRNLLQTEVDRGRFYIILMDPGIPG